MCLSFHISEIVFNNTSSLGKNFTHIAKATCAKLIVWRRISIILQNVKPCWLQIIEQSKNLGSFRWIGDPISKNYKTPSVSWQPDSWESQHSRKGKNFHACWGYFFVLHRCRHWCRPCDSWKSCETNWSCFFQHNRRTWIDLASSCGRRSSESPTASIPIAIMPWFIPAMSSSAQICYWLASFQIAHKNNATQIQLQNTFLWISSPLLSLRLQWLHAAFVLLLARRRLCVGVQWKFQGRMDVGKNRGFLKKKLKI